MGCNQTKISPSVLDDSELGNVSNASLDLSPVDEKAFSTAVCQQRVAAINNISYRETINTWRPSSIDELVRCIETLSGRGNQIDRAWIIFYWISQNICYDTDAFFNNHVGAQDAATIFQSKQAVCDGYSSLYAKLCDRTGIQCRKVNGYAKGFGFNVRQTKFDKTDHAWNIITLDNDHSYFVESTWGSGHLDSSTYQYKQNLVSHYFLCRPEHMIYGHLPEDTSCQLLAHPITVKQYLMLPLTYPSFFTYDLYIVSPAYSSRLDLIKNQSYGEVLIRTPKNNVHLSGSLKDEKDNKIEGGDFFYSDKDDQNLWRCQFAPPKSGKYNIFIFVGEKSSEEQTSSIAVQFGFDVGRLSSPPISYPLTWPRFFEYNLEIIKPKNARFIEWSSYTDTFYGGILVRSPENVHVSASIKDPSSNTNVKDGTLTNFDHQASLWQCLFTPSKSGVPFEITLFANRSDESESHCVAQFDLRSISNNNLKQCMTFPETYFSFDNNKCHLIEPLNGILQRGSTVHFRCQIPGVQIVKISVDSNQIQGDGLTPDENDMIDTNIQVGQQYVTIWVKLNSVSKSYEGLLKYYVR